jgi:hypothetical protein
MFAPGTQGVNKLSRIFDAKGKGLRKPEILRDPKWFADVWYCFGSQCAHWGPKHVSGAQVAGND